MSALAAGWMVKLAASGPVFERVSGVVAVAPTARVTLTEFGLGIIQAEVGDRSSRVTPSSATLMIFSAHWCRIAVAAKFCGPVPDENSW